MAKQTTLQILNKVLNNIGENIVSSGNLSSISGLALFTFNVINEVLYDIAFEYKYKPLEADGTITLGAGTSTYAHPSDMFDFDKDSFRYNEEKTITYYTPKKFDREFKTQTDTGVPTVITDWKQNWVPYKIPNVDAASKTIKYRYWKNPTVLSTDTEAGTCWIPEGFDLTLLADWVTWKVLHYKNNPEQQIYYLKIWGDGGLNEGNLTKFKDLYGSPDLVDGSIVSERFESRGGGKFVQEPITS